MANGDGPSPGASAAPFVALHPFPDTKGGCWRLRMLTADGGPAGPVVELREELVLDPAKVLEPDAECHHDGVSTLRLAALDARWLLEQLPTVIERLEGGGQ